MSCQHAQKILIPPAGIREACLLSRHMIDGRCAAKSWQDVPEAAGGLQGSIAFAGHLPCDSCLQQHTLHRLLTRFTFCTQVVHTRARNRNGTILNKLSNLPVDAYLLVTRTNGPLLTMQPRRPKKQRLMLHGLRLVTTRPH